MARLSPVALAAALLAAAFPVVAGEPLPAPTADALHAALKKANPEYSGKAQFRFRRDVLHTISLMRCVNVRDTSPLAAFDLRQVDNVVCYAAANIDDLSGFAGATKLTKLNIERCKKITDLSPVSQLPIGWIRMYELPLLTDLEALRNMPLWHLDMGKCAQVADLSPVAGKPLKDLRIDDCPLISDISLIAEMKGLTFLSLFNCTGIKDYRALAGLNNLEVLMISPELLSPAELAIVRGMTGLKLLGSGWGDWQKKMTPAQFWARHDAKAAAAQ
jgi:hypothetical protein